MPRLDSLRRYPVKSCRGESLDEAVVDSCGLAGDRRWLVIDADGVFVTAREARRMLLVTPTPRADGGLALSSPDAPSIEVDVPTNGALTEVRVWRSTLDAMLVSPAADTFFSTVLGRPARLVYLDDPTRRHPNPDFALPSDVVSFADGYPLLLTTSASLDALNVLIEQFGRADEGPLPMTRFRPNVVIDGTPAWAEDGWRRVRIGEATFRAVKGCDRCAITLTDPDTVARGKEPIATLAKHRQWDGAVWFGMNLVPDTPGAVLHVGDEVEVLDSVPVLDGPPR